MNALTQQATTEGQFEPSGKRLPRIETSFSKVKNDVQKARLKGVNMAKN
jgi:hypothetical protein